jgi:putative membrane protein
VLAVALLRRPGQPHQQPQSDLQPRQNPEEVLAERLARGDIDPEEYRQRLQTLQEITNRA